MFCGSTFFECSSLSIGLRAGSEVKTVEWGHEVWLACLLPKAVDILGLTQGERGKRGSSCLRGLREKGASVAPLLWLLPSK